MIAKLVYASPLKSGSSMDILCNIVFYGGVGKDDGIKITLPIRLLLANRVK